MRARRDSRAGQGSGGRWCAIICTGVILCATAVFPAGSPSAESRRGGKMQAFDMADLVEKRRQSGDTWIEFLRVPALSMGLYVLPAGGKDPQTPHAEDEVYYVVSGRGVLQVEEEDRPVEAGSIVFVGGKAKHRFHSITEELTLMVFFAPAENPDAAP